MYLVSFVNELLIEVDGAEKEAIAICALWRVVDYCERIPFSMPTSLFIVLGVSLTFWEDGTAK